MEGHTAQAGEVLWWEIGETTDCAHLAASPALQHPSQLVTLGKDFTAFASVFSPAY